MDPHDRGRALLARWETTKPSNFYEDDLFLRRVLARRLGPGRLAAVEAALSVAGAHSAGPVSRAAGVLDRPEHWPRPETWSAIGERTNEVRVHPLHDEVGRLVWRSGVLSTLGKPGHVTLHAAFFYLFALNGEVPHLCSVGCTAGLIKAIQRAGDERMRGEWLPRLLDPDYDRRWHAAQFLTEVQGGSDVGANACVARPDPAEPGAWRISGEKWFCSNVTADLYAVSARPEGAADGTRGIGLFVVPRRLADGRPNGVVIRRLKDKLGTRTLPTAELDFEGARGWALGDPDQGFKLLMGAIINTSRLAVAIGACGMMRRAWVEASTYARAREAFGRPLARFPAVARQLAEIRVVATAGLASTLWVASLEDRLALAGMPPEEDPLFRTAVNVNKYVCSADAGPVVHHAIEILGGNGTIEDFSPLPRLYREVPVQESWEGPHNTLMAQVLRDSLRSKMHDALLASTEDLLLNGQSPELRTVRERALGLLADARGRLEGLLRKEPDVAALHVRGLVGRIFRITQTALLLEETEHGASTLPWLPAAARFLLEGWAVPGYEPMDDPAYPDTVRQLVTG